MDHVYLAIALLFVISLSVGFSASNNVSLDVPDHFNKIQSDTNTPPRNSTDHKPLSEAEVTINFEEGTPDNLSFRDVCCDDSFNVVSEPVNEGQYAAKFLLRPTHNFSKVENNYYKTRNEVQSSRKLTRFMNQKNISVKGKDSWYGFSVRPDKNLKLSSTFEVIFQLHHINDRCDTQGGPPPFVIYVIRNRYVIQNTADSDQCQKNWSKVTSDARNWYAPLNRGEWTDWVIHTNWKHTEAGVLEVWRNGEKIVDYRGPVTYNDEKVHTFQFGVYKSPWLTHPRKSNRTYYFDNFRASGPGGSYREVMPR